MDNTLKAKKYEASNLNQINTLFSSSISIPSPYAQLEYTELSQLAAKPVKSWSCAMLPPPPEAETRPSTFLLTRHQYLIKSLG
jgi:hypothetical protein